MSQCDRLCKPTLAIQESFGRAADSGRWTGGFRELTNCRNSVVVMSAIVFAIECSTWNDYSVTLSECQSYWVPG